MTTLRILLLAGVAAVTVAGPANPATRAHATADPPKIMEGKSVAEAREADPGLNKCFGQQIQDPVDAVLTVGTLGLWRVARCLPESGFFPITP
jgi:hypothetical protein